MKKEGLNIQRRRGKVQYRKESFEIWEHFYLDPQNGETYTDSKLDEINLNQVLNQYRALHHIPFPAEITQLRKMYALSAPKMSEILDFGINTYHQYEQGEMPSLANAKLIRLAENPETFLQFVQEKQNTFSAKNFQKLEQTIRELIQARSNKLLIQYIWNQEVQPGEYTGFVKPTLEKAAHYVLFFVQQTQPLKTRLNKLLFYGDFAHYKQTGFAISGFNYRAIQMGPVPSHFHELFGILESQEFFRIEEELYEHGGVGERFVAEKKFDPTLFSEAELETMERIASIFEEKRTKEIIALSHEEEAWQANIEKRDLISYQTFAFSLRGA